MIDIAPGLLLAGALQLSEALRCFANLMYGVLKAYTLSVLKQSGLKCFREAPIVSFISRTAAS